MKKCLMTLAAVLCCTFLFTACSNVDNSGEPSVEAYAKATKTIAGYSFHTSEEMLAALDSPSSITTIGARFRPKH